MTPRSIPLILLLILTLALPAVKAAAEPDEDAWCKTHPAQLVESLARNESAVRQLERERARALSTTKAPPRVYSYDEIAVIEDDGTILTPPAPFDLSGKSIAFLRRPAGMSVTTSAVGYNGRIGTEVPFLFDVPSYVPFTNGMEFPFFDRVYSGAWISEDGYLSLLEPNIFDLPENPLDLLAGAAIIAPFFADLEEERRAGSGVYVNLLPGRVRITWHELSRTGSSGRVTAQVTLFENGRILFAYGDVTAARGVVGVFPGAAEEDPFGLDLSTELPQPPRRGAYFEIFTDEPHVNQIALIKTFYEHYQDRYDNLIVWLDSPAGTDDGAFQATFKNEVRGIGLPAYDLSRFLGLERFESYVQMGSLESYPDDPDQLVTGTYSTMDLLAHQVGHRYLGLVAYRSHDAGNHGAEVLNLGSFPEFGHWNFYFDTDGSFLGGNDFQGNRDGTFTTVDATSRYCDLDLYLMGLLPAEAVPSFYYLSGLQFGALPRSSPPQIGVTVEGRRVDVAIDDVTDAMGPRDPSSAETSEILKMAFVLVVREGEAPSAESLEKLSRFRRRWHPFFREATAMNGRVGSVLRPRN